MNTPKRCSRVSDSASGTVREKLDTSGFGDLRSVAVSGTEECIRLEGAVPSYYMKQMAGAIAFSVGGVLRVDNAVEVK